MRDLRPDSVSVSMNDHASTHDFVLTELPDDSLIDRLGRQLRHAAREIRSNPVAYFRSLVEGDIADQQTRRILWAVRLGLPTASVGGFVLGVLLYLCVFGRPVIVEAKPSDDEPLRVASFVDVAAQPAPEPAKAAPGGGGGGGENPLPASKGVMPPSSLEEPIVPATTKPFPPPPDPLPMPPPLLAPPVPVDPGVFGDPRSISTDPSDGPGSRGGIGTGKDRGVGAGEGPGKINGKDGGPSGPGGDPTGGGDRRTPAAVAVKARILNTPRPSYTEEARQKHTEGAVRVQVLLGADGRVRNARVVAGLPHGLNERALEAVSAIRFTPARDASGRTVDSSITVVVQFTIR